MTDPIVPGLVAAALSVLVLQAVDAVVAVVEARTVRDSDDPDVLTRRRGRDLFWALAVTATLAVLVAFGVDRAARLADAPGIAVLLLTTLAAFVVGCVGVLVVLRRERPTYARLRRDLRDRATFALEADELRDLEARLARADRLRDRRPAAALVLRVLGFVLVAAAAALVFVDLPALFGAALAGVVGHVVALVVALRAAAVRDARLDAVLETQRSEVVALLERARIPTRGRVPGLRDRVSRALAILREKQR